MKRVAIATLGCKVNQFESAAFAGGFEARGCVLAPFSAEADIYVINTCAVTAKAGQQSRQLIRQVLRAHPAARIVVTGCYAQMDPETVLDLSEQPLTIVGNGNKHRLVEVALTERLPDPVLLMDRMRDAKKICPLPASRFPDRTRAYLRIQDGCDNFCSYCIVPYTRGPSRSLNLAAVLDQAAVFTAQGYREIVVTGINVGKYGLDLSEGETINSLLDRLCRAFPDCRFRLSSIEATEVDEALLDLLARHANLMPHLHIPLQSGDDAVLARMNRRYSRAGFAATIRRIRERLPAVTIGCDVLGGFPGETEAEAANTYGLLAELPVDYLHVFPYSRRPGTLADSFGGQVPGPVKEERVRRLRALDAAKRQALYRANIGRVLQVLVERRQAKSGMLQGFSENYLPVLLAGGSHLLRRVAPVRLVAVEDGQPMGILAEDLLEESRQTK